MKPVRIILLLTILTVPGAGALTARAQLPVPTFSELFKQRKTQRKYLREQVALLQSYIALLKKGYQLVDEGLRWIDAIKHGDFNLHNGYFNSLLAVNPVVQRYPRVHHISEWYQRIAGIYHQVDGLVTDRSFTEADRSAIEQIFRQLLQEANGDLQQLSMLTTAGQFALKDDERIKRIEHLWQAMQERFAFCTDLLHSTTLLRVQRRKEQQDITITGRMIDLQP